MSLVRSRVVPQNRVSVRRESDERHSVLFLDEINQVRGKMSYYCYILYSKLVDTYYIGECIDIEQRMYEHNTGCYKQSYTSQTNDWKIYHLILCQSRSQARKIESHIKRMKSRVYIENLLKYPEITDRLITRYS